MLNQCFSIKLPHDERTEHLNYLKDMDGATGINLMLVSIPKDRCLFFRIFLSNW